MDTKTAAFQDNNPAGPSHRFLKTSLPRMLGSAAVVAAIAMPLSPTVHAAALGAVSIQSALGEPLRAEIQIPQLSSEEASTFNARMGSPGAFAAAGVSYNTALSNARISLQRRANGDAYLRITTNQPINEPVLGMVIEADWASGQITRDYTMLLDPPQPETAVAEQAAPESPRVAAAPAPQAPRAGRAEQVTRAPAPAPTPAPETASAPSQSARSDQVTIRSGDTASQIAVAHGLQGVSLDQMLLAMLRANPNAFIQGNVNLIRAGAVIQMPSAEQAQSVPRDEARRTVLAQTRDFDTYRSGLARNVQTTQETPAGQAAEGTVEPQVADTQQEQPEPDRLEISKADTDTSEQATGLAQSRQSQEQDERVAELGRNISELSELQEQLDGSAVTETAAAAEADEGAADTNADASRSTEADGSTTADDAGAASATDASQSADADPNQADDGAASPEADGADDAEAADDTASSDAGDDATSAVGGASTDAAEQASTSGDGAGIPVSTPTEQPPSFVDLITEYRWPIAAILIALLALFGIGRTRQSKRETILIGGGDSPDGKSGAPTKATTAASAKEPAKSGAVKPKASGARAVPTSTEHEDATTPAYATAASAFSDTAFAFTAVESDTTADSDLVKEADIYMEYGHDDKAEELLSKAMRAKPERADVYQRLATIHARRNDKAALATVAAQALTVTAGSGAAWQAIAKLGRELDPQNPLYESGAPADRIRAGAETKRSHTVPGTLSMDDAAGAAGTPTTWRETEKGVVEFLDPETTADTHNGIDTMMLDFDIDFDEPSKRGDLPTTADEFSTDDADATDDTKTADIADATVEELRDLAAKLEDDSTSSTEDTPEPLARMPGTEEEMLDFDLYFSAPDEHGEPKTTGSATPEPDATTAADSAALEFNLDDLDFIDDTTPASGDASPATDAESSDDPLATKLALAEEFHAIGDTEGAQSLARDVAKTATGALKEKAEAFLKTLGDA